MIKKFFVLLLVLCGPMRSYAVDLDGEFLSQSGELRFRFSADSLYIDIAQSGRNVSSFKLIKSKDSKKSTTFNAYESFLNNGQAAYREVLIKVTKQRGRKFLLEYFGKDKDREYNSNERYNIVKVKK